MSDTRHVVLIHGNWSRGEQLIAAGAAFQQLGFTAHTPTLRFHELPIREGATKVASLSIRDYADDLVAFVNSLESPPTIGWSLDGRLVGTAGSGTYTPYWFGCSLPGPRLRHHGFFDPGKPAHVPPLFFAPAPVG